jgi:hypothetical protein
MINHQTQIICVKALHWENFLLESLVVVVSVVRLVHHAPGTGNPGSFYYA